MAPCKPGAFQYVFGENYQALRYFRFDPPGTQPVALLNTIKTYLAAGLPSMIGFTVYNSISQAKTTGAIPFPRTPGDTIDLAQPAAGGETRPPPRRPHT